MAVTGVPSANSGHCSAIPDAVAALWSLRRGTRRARHCSHCYSAKPGCLDSTSSHVRPRTRLLLGEGSGVATRPLEEGCPALAAGGPDLPLEESGTSTRPSDHLSAHAGTLSRGVRDRHVPRYHWSTQDPDLQDPRNATTPHLEDCTPYSDDHAACWGWQDAGAISARSRTCLLYTSPSPRDS